MQMVRQKFSSRAVEQERIDVHLQESEVREEARDLRTQKQDMTQIFFDLLTLITTMSVVVGIGQLVVWITHIK